MIGWLPQSTNIGLASFRYRCLNPLNELKKRGYPVELFMEHRANKYRGVIFSKRCTKEAQKLAVRLRESGCTVILDLCDNHFYNPGKLPRYEQARHNILKMIELSNDVVCSTEALADEVVYEARLKRRPYVVSDAIEEFSVLEKRIDAERTNLLWFGMHGSPNAPSGMLDVLRLKPILSDLSREYALQLVIASNNETKFHEHFTRMPFPTRYIEWSRDCFPSLLATASAVIIPISINPFTACKTNNRPATALYAAVPVVADSIPSYETLAPFCFLDDWQTGLRAVLAADPEVTKRATEGQAFVREQFTISKIAEDWEKVIDCTVFSHHTH